jgi:NitT/TauT family transport system substrate-binding protein
MMKYFGSSLKVLKMTGMAALLGCSALASAADLKPISITEPGHLVAYLPVYVAIAKGYFAAEGLDVKMITLDGGSSHTNAVLAGQAFAFIGGPEHDAFAKLKGGELRTVIGVVNRGDTYIMAKKGSEPKGKDMASYLKGKRIATYVVGSTPNSITHYLLAKWGLDPNKDVTLIETNAAGVPAAMAAGQADVGMSTEPIITRGAEQGIWGEPIYSIPKELGPYAYSTLNVRYESITKDPKTVQGFVRAMLRALKETQDDRAETLRIAQKEFPTISPAALKTAMDRYYAEEIWSRDGLVSEQSWKTAKAVVTGAGILKQDVPYNDVIDMQFVNNAKLN